MLTGMDEGQAPRSEAVDTLLALAQGVIADERLRGQNLDSKTASLAAFSGTILALDVTLGQGLLRRELGSVGDWLLPSFFLLGAAGLLVAAAIAVVGVLRPQPYLAVGRSELEMPTTVPDKTHLQARMLATINNILPTERDQNNTKATLTKISACALGVGLLGIAGQAATLGLHELGV
jgi:hypothetical protein